jgi:hypothetical protein
MCLYVLPGACSLPSRDSYAASLGMELSINRKNRVLRAPATKIDLADQALGLVCRVFSSA